MAIFRCCLTEERERGGFMTVCQIFEKLHIKLRSIGITVIGLIVIDFISIIFHINKLNLQQKKHPKIFINCANLSVELYPNESLMNKKNPKN